MISVEEGAEKVNQALVCSLLEAVRNSEKSRSLL